MIPRTIDPGIAKTFKDLIDNVENILVSNAKQVLESCEMLARNLGEPRGTKEGQPEFKVV